MLRGFSERVRREGVRLAVKNAIGALLPDRFEVWHLAFNSGTLALAPRKDATLTIGSAAIKELKRRRVDNQKRIEFYREEIDGIQSCFLACVDDRLATIAWAYDHTKYVYFLRMHPGDAEIRHVYSVAEFRGRGLAKAVIAAACRSLFHDGFQHIYAVIHFRNEASLRTFRSIGFTRVAELKRPPLFGPRYVTAEGRTESWLDALGRSLRSWRFHPATPPDQQ